MTLNELTESVLTISPQLVDAREAAALIESCGINDRIAYSEFGVSNVFTLGEYILERSRRRGATPQVETKASSPSVLVEARFLAHRFSLSFAYAVPWTMLLVVEYLRPTLLQLPPEWGGVLNLSLIASLITAGGVSQAIARTGYFYIGIKEPELALRLSMLLFKCGLGLCCGLAALGVIVAHYFHLFPITYLLCGCANFLLLVALWMFCAMLSIQKRAWRIPLVFSIAAFVFAALHARSGVIVPMFAANAASVVSAAAFAILGFRMMPSSSPLGSHAPVLPRVAVLMLTLLPFFCYGFLYFALLFADRIAAGSAVPWASGLSFGIDAQYKRGMDIALFFFLVLAAVVEYIADNFTRYWFRIAEKHVNIPALLRPRYVRSLSVICGLFMSVAASLCLMSHNFHRKVLITAVLGSLGYFFIALALFNLILLFSVNCAGPALRLVALAVVCNFVTGYILSHLFGVEYAAIGLLSGGTVLFARSTRAMKIVLQHADYFYVLA